MYLAAYALRLGASGLTFFDDEVVQFFSLHAKEKERDFPAGDRQAAGNVKQIDAVSLERG